MEHQSQNEQLREKYQQRERKQEEPKQKGAQAKGAHPGGAAEEGAPAEGAAVAAKGALAGGAAGAAAAAERSSRKEQLKGKHQLKERVRRSGRGSRRGTSKSRKEHQQQEEPEEETRLQQSSIERPHIADGSPRPRTHAHTRVHPRKPGGPASLLPSNLLRSNTFAERVPPAVGAPQRHSTYPAAAQRDGAPTSDPRPRSFVLQGRAILLALLLRHGCTRATLQDLCSHVQAQWIFSRPRRRGRALVPDR